MILDLIDWYDDVGSSITSFFLLTSSIFFKHQFTYQGAMKIARNARMNKSGNLLKIVNNAFVFFASGERT